jgi:putative oxidoreductase
MPPTRVAKLVLVSGTCKLSGYSGLKKNTGGIMLVSLHPGLINLSLLLMRLMVGMIFFTSGWNDLRDPEARSRSIGTSKGFTIFLGACEALGSLGIMAGVLTQWAALGLILIGLGAIQKKLVVWKSGFWGEKSSGWHYDLMLVSMNFVIISTDGGNWVLWK